MACPGVSAIPHNQSYGAFENRGSEFIQPEERKEEFIETLNPERTSSVIEGPNKDLKSRSIVVLSSTIRNVAIIETVRFVAIVGLVCSAVASVLLPALGFAAIAAGACVLKNRAIQLDEKTQKDSDAIAREVTDRTLSESPSTRSQTSEPSSNGSIGRSRGASIATSSMSPISEEVFEGVSASAAPDIKEISLNTWIDEQKLNINQLRYLLTSSYSSLLDKLQDMPPHLERKGAKNETKKYLDQKFEHYSKEIQKNFPNLDNKGDSVLEIKNLEVLKGALKNAVPSSVMTFVKNVHSQIDQEEKKWSKKNSKDQHEVKAKHAEEYIAQLKTFEAQQKLHSTEDANN